MKLAAAIIAVAAVVSPATAMAEGGFFGFGIKVEAGWFIVNPKIKSATVRELQPDSEAGRKGVSNGDRITRVGECVIPGCRGKLAEKMLDVDVDVTREFEFLRPDGSAYTLELTAIPWPHAKEQHNEPH